MSEIKGDMSRTPSPDGGAKEAQVVPVVDIDDGFDPQFVKRTMRKVDWRLIPILIAMYTISLIDRTNLATARAANKVKMDREIGTGYGQRYTIITLTFFIPYIILEIPSQIGLRYFGVRNWLSAAVFLWGIIMICMGFAPNWNTLAGLRAVLGVFEAALFPGCAYLLSCWYPRRSMASRNVLFYTSSAVLGNFATILGYAFSLMNGTRGLSGWSWIFIWFGILTVIIAIIAYFALVDFPDRATFLSEEERHLVLTRIQRDRADSVHDPLTWTKIVKYSKDFKPWLFAWFFMSATVSSYALAYFLPVILADLGFTNVQSMVLNIPPNAWSVIPALVTGYIADKFRHMRAAVVIFSAICIIVGTAMYSQLGANQKVARYAGIFIAVQGGNCNVPLVLSWAQTSIRAQSKRAFMAAVVVCFGGLGGILASVAFNQNEAKKGYRSGVIFTMVINAVTVIGAAVLHFWMRNQNRRAERDSKVLEEDVNFRYQG
ncbi:hypothetical protein CcaverHIS002_0410510 [Cutaneotrichosporon cavernicola]|uniref:Major facilitator superfamily (MFS) profile domain-containing protein n=1 Tax=Cutaneotrichosporon cavernicola TaxID=279322 RepID=A0AA48QWD0_9TREE|nr:uncharacterized protein CcaverHIS019_0410410 [Cutaneotrichosporon cavernicola]BEI84447.1 hypothetical protein CcaverHIS002_0410510 [Cutaneotrichosporon cavernicola]BEI92221.1 hypothetical protein CcaverHIS019_0410410 [Cutaneotrichosporon cavernicola]BEI99992.1 hypothetical protein CcaverHIS631_0410350 [Cutaneotrichosporon cavernicola]BEJ07765.1 hypothetical protein CcaverHIS641_0410340 [Cutaneotrichosporon cavernicola]